MIVIIILVIFIYNACNLFTLLYMRHYLKTRPKENYYVRVHTLDLERIHAIAVIAWKRMLISSIIFCIYTTLLFFCE